MSSLKFDNILNIYNNDNIDEKINNFLISINDIDNLYLQLQLHKTIIDMKNELNNIHLKSIISISSKIGHCILNDKKSNDDNYNLELYLITVWKI